MDKLIFELNREPAAILLVLLTVLIVVLIFFVRRSSLRRKIKKEAAKCAETHPTFQTSYAFSLQPRTFASHSRLLKALSLRYGLNLPVLTRLDDYWLEQFQKKSSMNLLNNLLTYSPQKALFPIFEAGLTSSRYFSAFRSWILKSGDLMIMRSLAGSCNGRMFNGEKAYELTSEWREELYELTGDPMWKSRWFSLHILMYDQSPRAERALWSSFEDPSFQIRKLLAGNFVHQDEQKLYSCLQNLMLNDSVFEVRKAARRRIESDFLSFYSIPASLTHTQKLHITEQLNPQIQQDREYAFSLLDSGNEELALEASRVLSQSGSLHRLFQQVFFEDSQSLKRTLHLLTNAARVHCTAFLNALEESRNPGTLLVAAHLLREYGDRKYITDLVHQVRSFDNSQKSQEPIRGIYLNALETACMRGDDNALILVRDELSLHKSDASLQERILPLLPEDRAHVYIQTLFSFLGDRSYPAQGLLRTTLAALKPDLTLPALFEIIKGDEAAVGLAVQEQALRILCEIGIPYTIQHVLEHLPLLSVEKASRYSSLLARHFTKNYKERVSGLLKSTDSRLRSRLIGSIPPDFFDFFKKELIQALQDSDPDVRSACAWTLMAHGTQEDQKLCLSLLHDPVEAVRINSARAFAEHGGSEFFNELKKVLESSNEMIPVKLSIIDGLSKSSQEKSVDILVEQVVQGGELQEKALLSLSKKQQSRMILRLLSHISKADHQNRELLMEILRSMGESAEYVLEAALVDAADSLRPVAVEVLESIGSIDARIRHLSNRDPSVRREAAAFLLKTGTRNAYRGLIQAARDPDEEVRTFVVKALDELNSDKGKAILEELKNDPHKKVRTYTKWALERYNARRL